MMRTYVIHGVFVHLVGRRSESARDDRDRDRANRTRYPKYFYRRRLALRTISSLSASGSHIHSCEIGEIARRRYQGSPLTSL